MITSDELNFISSQLQAAEKLLKVIEKYIRILPVGNDGLTDPDITGVDRELAIFQMRNNGMTLQSIGDAFNISRERVRQLQIKGTKKIRMLAYRAKVLDDEAGSIRALIDSLLSCKIEPVITQKEKPTSAKADRLLSNGEAFDRIAEFFDDPADAETFYLLFKYSSAATHGIKLDVRENIIGVKVDGERLRFYSKKNGEVTFPREGSGKKVMISDHRSSITSLLGIIDTTNEYFDTHKKEVGIVSEKTGE